MPLTPLPDLSSLFAVLRAGNGTATVFDANGVLQQVTATQARQDFSLGTPTGRMNLIANPRLVGSSSSTDNPGTGFTTVGSPASGWVEFPNLLVSGFAEDDIEYVEYRFQPPAAQAASFTTTLAAGAALVPAGTGSTWTVSAYRRRTASGAPTTGTNFRVGIRELDSGGAVLAENFTESSFGFVTLASGRLTYTHTVSNANTRFVQAFIAFVAPAGGSTVRVRVGGYQLEAGAATPLLRPPAGMIRQEAEVTGNTARGLLLEEDRTNFVWNNRALGAVPGSPGSVPSSWLASAATGSGISRSIVATGTEDGIPYVDVRWSGVSTATHYPWIGPQSTMPVLPGSRAVFSSFLRLIAGSLPTNLNLFVNFQTAEGGYIPQIAQTVTPTYAPLRLQRYANRCTVPDTAATATCSYAMTINNGATVDFTLRIALPQLEKGARETSPILNGSGVTTAAMSRGRDTWSSAVPLAPLHTLHAKVLLPFAETKQRGIMQVTDGGWNRTALVVEPDGTLVAWRTARSGTVTAGTRVPIGTATPGTPFTVQVGADRGGIFVAMNGGTPVAAISPAPVQPTALHLGADAPVQGLFIGQTDGASFDGLNGYIQEFAVANHRVGTLALVAPGALSALSPMTRAQSGNSRSTTFGSGDLKVFGVNTPRFTGAGNRLLVEPSVTNYARNPFIEGGTLGLIGSGGAFPSFWNAGGPGVGAELVGRGVEDGIPYLDIRLFGVTSSSYFVIEPFGVSAGLMPTAGTGVSVTSSVYIRRIAGNDPGGITRMHLRQYDSGGAGLTDVLTSMTIPSTGTLKNNRVAVTQQTNNASAASSAPFIQPTPGSGVTVDVTYRVGLPQTELRSVATTVALPAAGTTGTGFRSVDWIIFDPAELFPDGAGALLVTLNMPTPLTSGQTVCSLEVDGNNRFTSRVLPGATSVQHLTVLAGAATTGASQGTIVHGTPFVYGLLFSPGRVATCINGGALAEMTSVPSPPWVQLRLGSRTNGADAAVAEFIRAEAVQLLPSDAAFQALVAGFPLA